jgi:hypothetical protein
MKTKENSRQIRRKGIVSPRRMVLQRFFASNRALLAVARLEITVAWLGLRRRVFSEFHFIPRGLPC